MTAPAVGSVVETYDELAAGYDERYSDPTCLHENQQVARWLSGSVDGTVLDLGCGTGLLLDLLGDRIDPDSYMGVDPSEGMLRRHLQKHPGYPVIPAPAEEAMRWIGDRDLITGLFGAASYVDAGTIRSLPHALAPAGRLFLMVYRPGYAPDYELPMPCFGQAVRAVVDLANWWGWTVYEWRQFVILDGHRAEL